MTVDRYTITDRPKERDVLIDHGPDRPLIFAARREGVEGSDAEAPGETGEYDDLADALAALDAVEVRRG